MLLFDVTGQTLTRKDKFEPATDSVEYLVARFTFKTTDWNGAAKSALFRIGDIVYEKLLDSSGGCKVPYEVLEAPTSRYFHTHGSTFNISLVGQNGNTRITTNEIPVKLKASGYVDAGTPANPTETMYQQLLTAYADNEAAIQAAQAECETARADLVGVKNLFANGIKGKVSGSVVRADDVSPVEHNPVVVVHGKNLWNMKAIENTESITINADGSATIASGIYYAITTKTLQEVCPALRVGDVVTFSISTNGVNYIYLASGANMIVIHGYTITVTQEMLDSIVVLYGVDDSTSDFNNSHTVNWIQLEKGTEVTNNVNYLSPETISVKRCGVNIIEFPYYDSTKTANGLTFTVLDNGEIYITGTATAATYFSLRPNMDGERGFIQKGNYTLSMKNNATSGVSVFLILGTNDGQSIANVQCDTTTTFEIEEDCYYWLFVKVGSGTVLNNVPLKPQLESGNKKSAFAKYAGTIHTVSSNGAVEGVETVSPTMTIMTNTEGVTVECEYIRDTNKVIESIENAIAALNSTT